jgi:hypothetical protein
MTALPLNRISKQALKSIDRKMIFTAPENWSAETAKKLEAIIGKYAPK